MARFTLAVLTGALVLASPVLANDPVRPTAVLTSVQPVSFQSGARVGALTSKKKSDIAPAATGAILAGLVALGGGIGLATSSGGHGSGTSTSP